MLTKKLFLYFNINMKVNQKLSFKGINVGQTNILGHQLNIYHLTRNDIEFTEYLAKNVKLGYLLSEMPEDEFKTYKYIFKNALSKKTSCNNHCKLLTCDDIPCGIMVNKIRANAHFVDYVCTWPIRKGEKAPFGAKTLFTQLYTDFLKTDAKYIELYAIRYRNLVSKYMEMGFKSRGGQDGLEIMRIYADRVKEFLEKLLQQTKLEPTSSKEDENLFEKLRLNNDFLEKI